MRWVHPPFVGLPSRPDVCLAFDLLTTLALLHGAANGTAHLTWPLDGCMALHHYRLRGVLSASSRAVCPGFCRFNSLGGLTTSLSQPCWRGSSLTRGYSLLANGCGYSAGAATRRLLIGLGPTSVTRNHLLLLSTAPVVTTLLGALTRRLTWSFAYTLAMLRFSLGCVRVRCHSTAPAPFHGASPPPVRLHLYVPVRLHLLALPSISWPARALLASGGFLIARN